MSGVQYCQSLYEKLAEEVAEVKKATEPEEIVEEITDVLEVLEAICHYHKITHENLEAVKQKKFSERGGFYKGKFVTVAEHPPHSLGEKGCLEQPDKYPEIL